MFSRALILGATGMIGAHALRACLRRGIAVRALIRPQSDRRLLEGRDVEIALGDLFDRGSLERALAGCDLAIHCAAAYPTRYFGKRAFLTHARTGMANVLAAAAAATGNAGPGDSGLRRLVYVSSATTIGRPPGTESSAARPAREDDLLRVPDQSPYFAAKSLMEDLARDAAAEGVPLVIVNPTFCVDEYDDHRTTAQLMIPLAKGQIPAYLPGTLNAVPTRDVGEGIVRAAERGRIGERYILGGENLTSREFLARCAETVGVSPPRVAMPIPLAEALSWITEAFAHLGGGRPLFPMAGIRMMKWSQPYATDRAREELGYTPSSVTAAIERAYAYYRARGWL
ncbi:MAG: NAD-dependent epimerase/dehydratase family protein [Candidatus Eisenbacteria sp.]|nr:NAD-dependent epimerase/dehydratase family protein [Candidatus Eisenbacteria bacterium]